MLRMPKHSKSKKVTEKTSSSFTQEAQEAQAQATSPKRGRGIGSSLVRYAEAYA